MTPLVEGAGRHGASLREGARIIVPRHGPGTVTRVVSDRNGYTSYMIRFEGPPSWEGGFGEDYLFGSPPRHNS